MSDSDTYEVEKIMDSRMQDGRRLYRVRWAGFTEKDDTWEPYENLNEACRVMIENMYDTTSNYGSEALQEDKLCKGVKAINKLNQEKSTFEKLTEQIITRCKSRRLRKALKTSLSPCCTEKNFLENCNRKQKATTKKLKRKTLKSEKRQLPTRKHVRVENGEVGLCENCDHAAARLRLKPCCGSASLVKSSNERCRESSRNAALTSTVESDEPEDDINNFNNNEFSLDVGKKVEEACMKECAQTAVTCERGSYEVKDVVAVKSNFEIADSQSTSSSIKEGCLKNDAQTTDRLPPEYSELPIKKIVGLSFEELDMALFMSKESTPAAGLSSFQGFRAAALEGNLVAVKNYIRTSGNKKEFNLNAKHDGKTLLIEICEKKCDDAHLLDDILHELVRGGACLDAVDDALGRTPLHFAIVHELWCRVRTLLMLRSPVNIKDKDGKTPLDLILTSHTSNYNIKRTIFLLFEFGADVNEIVKKEPKLKFIEYLMEYQKKVQDLFNSALAKVIMNISIRSCITPIIIRGLWELENKIINSIYFDIKLNALPHKRYFHCLIFAVFDYHGPHSWRIRMWGDNPFAKILMNNELVTPLQPETNTFLYVVRLVDGSNQLQVFLNQNICESKLLLLTQGRFVNMAFQIDLLELRKPAVV